MGEAARAIDRLTADELWRRSGELDATELIDGEVIIVPSTKIEHGRIESTLAWALGDWARRQTPPRPMVVSGEVGYQLDAMTVRAPDVALHLTAPAAREGWTVEPPELLVEVVSPSDRFTEVESKVDAWIRFGVREVWIVEPRLGRVVVREGARARILADGVLETTLLPGFSLALADLFA